MGARRSTRLTAPGPTAGAAAALVRNRPDWGLAETFFASQANLPRPTSYNYLWAGSVGGPVVPGRTFVFGTTEGYKTREIREAVLMLPTALERAGDFSRSVDAAGRPIVIYDPLSTRADPLNPGQSIRDPFPGNIIPADRIDPVARELLRRYPWPDTGRTATRSVSVSDLANQATIKVDHQVSRALRSSGLVFYGGLPSDPALGDTEREVNVLALNNLFTPGGATVYEVRYGYLSFVDDFLPPSFDVGQLGFASRYTSALPVSVFPTINLAGYNGMGTILPRETRFLSHALNGAITRLVGTHTIKAGADYRRVGLNHFEPGSSGSFGFSSAFTQGPNPLVGSTTAGDAVASLLLGAPASGSVLIGTPFKFDVHYGALFVQDDVRVSSAVTLNLGLRYEYETGLRESHNQLTVGFDRDRAFPIQVPGLTLRGGLIYAGVDGNPTHQSNPDRAKLGPRAGLSWALGDRAVVRGGYGLFWAPHQFQFPNESTLGTRGFSATTSYFSSADGLRPCPACALRDPFPNGIDLPQGSAQGMLTGAGGEIHFNDQSRRSPYLHKFSVDVQHELPLAVTLRAGYISSRGERLDVGGASGNARIAGSSSARIRSLSMSLRIRSAPAARDIMRSPPRASVAFAGDGAQA
jgi:hypothetical protein